MAPYRTSCVVLPLAETRDPLQAWASFYETECLIFRNCRARELADVPAWAGAGAPA